MKGKISLLLSLLAINNIFEAQNKPQSLAYIDTQQIAIGYGKQTRKEIASSIASITHDNFNKSITNNPVSLLQGKVAGFNIVKQDGGDPMQNRYQILLRGINTFVGETAPLYIVDGVPTYNLNTVQAEDIESIEMLKDGSAAAIYGMRANSGVIIITTKRGYNGRMSIEYSGDIGFGITAKYPRVLSAEEYRKYMVNDKLHGVDWGENTDWFDEVTRVPLNTSHTLSIAGGIPNFKYRSSINYKNLQGLAIKNDYQSINARINIDQSAFKDRLNISYNLAYANDKGNLINPDVFDCAMRANPTSPVRLRKDDPNYEKYNGWFIQVDNPVARIMEDWREQTGNIFWGSINASVNVTDWLSISTIYSLQYAYTFDHYDYNYYDLIYSFDDETTIYRHLLQNFSETTLRFSKQLRQHNLRAFVGYVYQNNFESEKSKDIYGGSTSTVKTSTTSFLWRINYSWNEMLYFNASLCADGSDKYASIATKLGCWGLFPAGSLAWRIAQLPSLKNNKDINELKLRFGYGITGNLNLPHVTYSLLANSLKWETQQEYNLGIDFSFLENRLFGSIDAYLREIKDVFLDYPLSLYGAILDNAGQIQNKGIELTLNVVAINKNNFVWSICLVTAANANKIKTVSADNTDYRDYYGSAILMQSGVAMNSFYGYEFANIDVNGIMNYYNKDGEIVSAVGLDDKKFLGNANPYFTFGLNTTISWKWFDFYLGFRGQVGGLIFNKIRYSHENTMNLPVNAENILLSAVEPNAAINKVRIAANIDWSRNPLRFSSFYLENASYLKLSDIAISFNCPLPGKVKKHITSLKFRFTAQNICTITGYSGIDPEVIRGYDGVSYYPHQRTFLFGISAAF